MRLRLPSELVPYTCPLPSPALDPLYHRRRVWQLRQGRDHVPLLPAQAGLDTLDDAMPHKLLRLILTQMDVHTLAAFACANRRASEMVQSLLPYQRVLEHAPAAWHEILHTRRGPSVALARLDDALCAWECDGCGYFGPYLYLLTCQRVCWACATGKADYRPVPYAVACRAYGLPGRSDVVRALPRMLCRPDGESDSAAPPVLVVDALSAERAGRALGGRDEARAEPVEPTGEGASSRPPVRGWSPRAVSGSHPFLWAALVPIPYFDRARGKRESGFLCRACRPSSRPVPVPLLQAPVFTPPLFIQHLRACGPVVDNRHQPRLLTRAD